MDIKNKLTNKIKMIATRTYKKTAPIIKKEVQKTIDKGKENVICSILDGVEVIILGTIMLSIVIKPSDILKVSEKSESRINCNSYYEVHVTNNYYLKGEKLK